jgi:hypothetical protein
MSDRFDFLEIDDRARSRVRRIGADERRNGGQAASPEAHPEPAPEPLLTWRVVETVGRTGPGVGEFRAPRGLAIDRRGSLYVADSLNHRVQRIATDGGVALLDRARGAPHEPILVAVDDDLAFYVAGTTPGPIHAFSADGTALWRWNPNASTGRTGQLPLALAVDRRSLLLLGAAGERVLRVRIPEGGRPPAGIEEIAHPGVRHPRGLCTDGRGLVFLAAANPASVTALHRTGDGWEVAWHRSFEEKGLFAGLSAVPMAAAGEHLFLAASRGVWVMLSAHDGRAQRYQLQGMGDDPPAGPVALGPDGSLYIVSASDRIYRLKPAG